MTDETRPAPGGHPGHYLTAYVLGNLSQAGQREVESHVAACKECAEELEALRSTRELVEGAVGSGGGSPEALELDRERLGRLLVTKSPRPKNVALWLAGAAIAGVACVIVMYGLNALNAFMIEPDYLGGPADESGRFEGLQATEYGPTAASAPWEEAAESPPAGKWKDEAAKDLEMATAGSSVGPEEPGVVTNTEKPSDPGPARPAQDPRVPQEKERAAGREDLSGDFDRASLIQALKKHSSESTEGIGEGSRDPEHGRLQKTWGLLDAPMDDVLFGVPGDKPADPRSLPEVTPSLEPQLRAYLYYKSLDRVLEWENFKASDLAVPPPVPGDEGLGRDEFLRRYGVEPFVDSSLDRESTFGMDVDTASFTRARALLRAGELPDPRQVRVEEFVNYFRNDYEANPDQVFSVFSEAGASPFGGEGVDLVSISVKARELGPGERRKAILTLAIDTSGSMYLEDRLELVKRSLATLVRSLDGDDRVGIVAYSSHAYLVLPHTPAREASRIAGALESLSPHGESNVEAGLEMAYHLADEVFEPRGLNRVILASDGVATAGARGPEEILAKVKVYADRGIYLSTVGFGRTKYDDRLMESLADNGNGRYDYVGSAAEAQRFFSGSLPGNLEVLAKDAKIQVVWNPEVVSHYRLLGYENRDIEDERFRDDTVDAGEVGPGTTVTALYEVRRVPRAHGELARVHVRFLSTVTSRVEELEFGLPAGLSEGPGPSEHFLLLACVAETAELLRGSYWARDGSFEAVLGTLQSMSEVFRNGPAWRELAEVVGLAWQHTVRDLGGGK
ncbi:MAG: von Willebrand factor type A domain-containing protein [Planctomycetes bacterium]|nr:von Willebrand factor type A domain-containing protein [Planctomycetota bacterium]